jgi:hypothetical protein
MRSIIAAVLALLTLATSAGAIGTEALVDSLQYKGFRYFWDEANPANGLVKDRSTPGSPCSIAAVGFGLSSICIAIDHGWITREDGADRVLTTLQTFRDGPQGDGTSGFIGYQGFFYHFLDMTTGARTWNCELSTIDTALLMAGVLDAKHYFDGAGATETEIRSAADSLYRAVDWEWARASGIGIRMGWTPEGGFAPFGNWVGYNEATILYVMAIGHPVHPITPSLWFTWTSGYTWNLHYGYEYVEFPPLFGHQYSHCWIDFRSIQDGYMQWRGITYFENSRRATLAQREYCIANPGGWVGYGPDLWGLTASDDPGGYLAHGAPPPQNDNGTITPTAAASSIAFAPEVVIPALHYMYDNYGGTLWGPYGFLDAFNPTVGWTATDYLGIDQGPIVIMIENWRNGSVWDRFMQDPDIQNGLALAGFEPAVGVENGPAGTPGLALAPSRPNPVRGLASISYDLPAAADVTLDLFDVTGRRVRTLDRGVRAAGSHRVSLDARDLPAGVYWYRLRAGDSVEGRKCTIIR